MFQIPKKNPQKIGFFPHNFVKHSLKTCYFCPEQRTAIIMISNITKIGSFRYFDIQIITILCENNMLIEWKKFPQNVRALKLLAEEVPRYVIECSNYASSEDLIKDLEKRASQSKTVKWWIYILIKPVFIMMSYIRAERKGDWLLHLSSFRQMIPYYFAAGDVHYAGYGLYYLRTKENLPPHVLCHF